MKKVSFIFCHENLKFHHVNPRENSISLVDYLFKVLKAHQVDDPSKEFVLDAVEVELLKKHLVHVIDEEL